MTSSGCSTQKIDMAYLIADWHVDAACASKPTHHARSWALHCTNSPFPTFILTDYSLYNLNRLPMHTSVDVFSRVSTGRDAPNGPLLDPMPPPSELPWPRVAYRTRVHDLDSDSLLQIFSCYRLEEQYNWNIRFTWQRLAHVCRRWRHLIFDSWFHLDMCLLLTNDSLPIDTLSHLSPLPLVIDYPDGTRTMEPKDEDNIYFALQQHGRVRQVVLQAPSSSLRIWLEPMNKFYPRLKDLSLLSTTTEEMDLVLPETIQAPILRLLSLHGIGLPKGLPLLSSTTTLSTLSLTHIRDACYFPPIHLVTQLQNLPHLEELSIGFAIPIPLPSSARDLLPAPIPSVTLPTLRRLTFLGVDIYLDNLVAQINTPLLDRLSVTLFFDLVFSLVNLTEFIHRTEGVGCLVSRVIFSKDGPSIYYEQQGIDTFSIRVNCGRLDLQIDSATQVCIALGDILPAVEELTLDLDVDGIPSDWQNSLDSMMWHELLLPFIGVKKLRIGSSLSLELSKALESVTGELVLELLPELQELEVHIRIDLEKNALSTFVKTRESVGRPVYLRIDQAEHFAFVESQESTLGGQASREPGSHLDHELWWRDHYREIESRGYILRPRYHPNWRPSWKRSRKNYFTTEDGQPSLFPSVMDAMRAWDGRQVILKKVPVRTGQQELEIARRFSSPDLRRDSRNHCVPLLETLELPESLDQKLMVMPYLRPFDKPQFRTFGEFVAFLTQICEGLQFMHERKIAHRDCTANNIMLDPSGMYPEGFHPIQIDRSRDFRGRATRYDRTQRPPRYYLIGFGLSRHYSSRIVLDRPLLGGDKSVPEHKGGRLCNPFHTDIYYLGNLIREHFLKRYNGFGFMEELVGEMTDANPTVRPAIERVVEKFSHIRNSLSEFKLRSLMVSKKDTSLITTFRYSRQMILTTQNLISQRPAIPDPY